jgi:hypothetical protein
MCKPLPRRENHLANSGKAKGALRARVDSPSYTGPFYLADDKTIASRRRVHAARNAA